MAPFGDADPRPEEDAPLNQPPAAPRAPGGALALPRDLARRYEALELLGKGSFGQVLRVWDRELDREAAVKLLQGSLGDDAARRFLREARLTAAVRHPNVVEIYASGTGEGGTPYIVYELVSGPDLARLLEAGGPIAPEVLRRLGRELAAALTAVHDAGLIHRDVKPSNILQRAGDPRKAPAVLCDFGLSQRVDPETFRTTQGKVLGSLRFMAPEILLGEPANPRSDQFSLGVSLYWLLTGTYPFEVDALLDHASLGTGLPVPESPEDPEAAAVLADILPMISALPEKRYPDLACAAAALAGAGVGEASPAPAAPPAPLPARPPPDPAPARRPRGNPVARAGLLGAALLAGALVWGLRPGGGAPSLDRFLPDDAIPRPTREALAGPLAELERALDPLIRLHGPGWPRVIDPDHASARVPMVTDPRYGGMVARALDALSEVLATAAALDAARGPREVSPFQWASLSARLHEAGKGIRHCVGDLRQVNRHLTRELDASSIFAPDRFLHASALMDPVIEHEDTVREAILALLARGMATIDSAPAGVLPHYLTFAWKDVGILPRVHARSRDLAAAGPREFDRLLGFAVRVRVEPDGRVDPDDRCPGRDAAAARPPAPGVARIRDLPPRWRGILAAAILADAARTRARCGEAVVPPDAATLRGWVLAAYAAPGALPLDLVRIDFPRLARDLEGDGRVAALVPAPFIAEVERLRSPRLPLGPHWSGGAAPPPPAPDRGAAGAPGGGSRAPSSDPPR